MRILIIGINYAPEVTGIAPYTTQLAEGLVERGHRVTVFTGMPHYPEWKVAAAYEGRSEAWEHIRGVRIRRFSHHVSAGGTLAGRTRLEVSFGRRAVSAHWGNPDLVITVTPPLMASAMIVARARAQRIPVGTIVQDLYGRGVEETGGGGALAKGALAFESAVLRGADGVSVIHRHFRDSVIDMGVQPDAVSVNRNWSHLREPDARSREEVASIRHKHGWSDDECVVLHTGNMGLKQGLHSVVEAAQHAEAAGKPLRFVLVGNGNQRAALEAASVGIERLQFIDPLPDAEYSDVLAAADMLLVNELPGLRGMAVPSKLTTYFAAGRPVLAAVAGDGVSADEVRSSGAGVVVAPGEPQQLVTEALALANDSQRCEMLAAQGPIYANRELGQKAGIDAYEQWCAGLVAKSSAALETTAGGR
ncbi:glycosyltransferase family 4 protein [Gordonia sp. NPDC003429]